MSSDQHTDDTHVHTHTHAHPRTPAPTSSYPAITPRSIVAGTHNLASAPTRTPASTQPCIRGERCLWWMQGQCRYFHQYPCTPYAAPTRPCIRGTRCLWWMRGQCQYFHEYPFIPRRPCRWDMDCHNRNCTFLHSINWVRPSYEALATPIAAAGGESSGRDEALVTPIPAAGGRGSDGRGRDEALVTPIPAAGGGSGGGRGRDEAPIAAAGGGSGGGGSGERSDTQFYAQLHEQLLSLCIQLLMRPIEGMPPVAYTPDLTTVMLAEGETIDHTKIDKDNLVIRTSDGFNICIRRMAMPCIPGFISGNLWFNGYVTVPDEIHELSSYIRNTDAYNINGPVKLTYKENITVGWDHTSFSTSDEISPLMYGPAQVL